MNIDLTGKVAVVTGAGSGIGAALAQVFSSVGARVGAVDIDREALDRLRDSLAREGSDEGSVEGTGEEMVHPVVADVSREPDVQSAMQEVIERYGGVDILCANAGIVGGGPVQTMTVEEWDRVIDVDLKSVFLCVKHVVPSMIERGGGRIVATSSYFGRIGTRGGSSYCAAKFGVIGLVQSYAHELGCHNILVNAIAPGDVDTPMMAHEMEMVAEGLGVSVEEVRRRYEKRLVLGRLQRPVDVAWAAAFLASDFACNITGETLGVTGGLPLTNIITQLLPSDSPAFGSVPA
jgi:NAD(P)-dependent dehydrogenase (short-subunit alcohol dehydrogenase family)